MAIAVEGPQFNTLDSLNLMVAAALNGSWDRTYGAGKNLASKLGAIFAGETTVHCYESFYKRYSDTGLWWADSIYCCVFR